MMTELQTQEGLDDAHRGAGCSYQLGNAEQGHAIGVLSNFSSIPLLLHRGWSQLQQVHDDASDLIYRGLSQESCPCTTQHNIKDITKNGKHHLPSDYSAAFSGRSASTVWKQLTPFGLGAMSGQLQALHRGPLLTALHLSHPTPALFARAHQHHGLYKRPWPLC